MLPVGDTKYFRGVRQAVCVAGVRRGAFTPLVVLDSVLDSFFVCIDKRKNCEPLPLGDRRDKIEEHEIVTRIGADYSPRVTNGSTVAKRQHTDIPIPLETIGEPLKNFSYLYSIGKVLDTSN